MNIEYKQNVMSKLYIILLSLICIIVLGVGTAFARYLAQSEHNIGFSAAKPTQIYLNQTEIINKTLFKPQMTQFEGKISAEFTLKNYISEINPEAKKVKFQIKAFVLRDGEELQKAEDALPLQITISDDVNNVVYNSKVEKTSEKTDFYKINQKKGDIFRFFESENADSEKIYQLEGENNNSVTFNLTANNVDFDAQNLFVCVELVK